MRLFVKYFILLCTLFPFALHADKAYLTTITQAIQAKFLETYPSMSINVLNITPLGKMPKQFQDARIEKITFTNAALKRQKGTFSVLFANDKKRKKRYYKYALDASIGIYMTEQILKKNSTLQSHHVRYQTIPFKHFAFKPIDERYFLGYETKRTIRDNRMLTINDLRRIVDVKRGNLLDATLQDGSVALTFKVRAIQEGNVGDIIKVKRGHYKNFKGQITTPSTVEIIE